MEQKGIRLELENSEEAWVWGDEFKVEEVITNYMSNAINHADGEKLIQSQQFFHHTVHFIRFVNDNFTIKFTAFCIIINTLLQSFRITLDQCQRCLQLMGHVRQKFFSHLINLYLFLNIILQMEKS